MNTDMRALEKTTDTDKRRLRVWLRLLRVSRSIEGELRERLRVRYKSTLPRFDVLAALFRQVEGLKMSELSSALMVSNGNVTGIIERLVGEGMVERTPIPNDRRAMKVRLTKKGRQDFAEMAEVHQGWISELLEGISGEDADLVCGILDLKITAKKLKGSGE